jgi:hypothetical protein
MLLPIVLGAMAVAIIALSVALHYLSERVRILEIEAEVNTASLLTLLANLDDSEPTLDSGLPKPESSRAH